VELVDIYPTLCELTGLSKPEHLEGLSLMPLLHNPQLPWKKAAFSQFYREQIMGYSVRTAEFRYTEWKDKTGTVTANELYDHRNDPEENVNVVAEAAYKGDAARMSEVLNSGWKKALPAI
jgi:arylsulfatase A-like enzyme